MLGRRAIRTELVCRVWQTVQVPIVPSLFGFANAVTLLATAGHRRTAFQLNKRMRRPARAARLIRFRKIYLFWRETFFPIDSAPCRRGVAAAQKLLVDTFVATAAIACGQFLEMTKP